MWRRLIILIMRIGGLALVAAGAVFAYWWHIHIKPLRNMADPAWCVLHSDEAHWAECQKCFDRSLYFHDIGFYTGQLGDKQWLESFMARLRPEDEIVGCGAGHLDHGLQDLTNQNPGESASDWLRWWEENKDKTQEEWVRRGFENRGIVLETPLSVDNIVSLLTLIDRAHRDYMEDLDYLAYNAKRWLWHCEFDTHQFLNDHQELVQNQSVLHGVVEYEKSHYRFAQCGDLLDPNRVRGAAQYAEPRMNSPRVKFVANVAIFLLIATGAGLCWQSIRCPGRRSEPLQLSPSAHLA